MLRSVSVLSLWLAFSSLPVHAQSEFKGPEFFPVANFSSIWTYRVEGQGDRLYVNQVPDQVGVQRCYRYEGRIRNQLVVSEHLSIRKEGVYRLRHDGIDLEPPLLIFRFPPVKGDKWKGEYKINDKKTTITYECDMEELMVMRNKVNTVVIRGEIGEADGTLKNTCWYAPKYGLVKQVIEEADAKIVIELETHGSPKKGGPKLLVP